MKSNPLFQSCQSVGWSAAFRFFSRVIAFLLIGVSSSYGHLCGPREITLTLGQTTNVPWQITADLTEVLSDYRIVQMGDTNIAMVAPTANFREHHGVWTFTPVAVGETRFRMHWYYDGTGASAECEVLVKVVAPPPPQSTYHSSTIGDPVWGSSGEYRLDETDLMVSGAIPIAFKRHYGSQLGERISTTGSLGRNWMHNYEMRAEVSGTQCRILMPEGQYTSFFKSNTGAWQLEGSKHTAYLLKEENGSYLFLNPELSLLYRFEAAGRLIEINDFNGNIVRLTYVNDRLSRVEDALGRGIRFTYDSNLRLSQVQDHWGRTVIFGYEDQGPLISVRGINSQIKSYTYTSTGARFALLTAVKLPKGNSHWTNVYDDRGRVIRQVDANGNSFQFTYPSQANDPTRVITPQNATLLYHHQNGAGTERVGPGGETVRAQYDAAGRRTAVTDAEGHVSAVRFDDKSGLIASYTDPNGQVWNYAYVMRQQNGFPIYDLAGIRFPDGSGSTNIYDASGNLIAYVNRAGARWQYSYNSRGQILTVTNPQGAQIAYSYNADGTAASFTDCAGNKTTFTYDNFQRLIALTYPDGSTARFEYDSNSNIIARVDEAGRRTSYEFDVNGNLLKMTDSAGQETRYTYDAMDRLESTRDPLGRTTTLAYNEMGQISQVTGPSGDISKLTYNNLGQLTSFTDAEGNVWQQRYDANGNLTETIDPLGKSWRTEWDGFGRRKSETNPEGHQTSYVYDALGRLAKIINALGHESTYTFNALDMLTEVQVGSEIRTRYGLDNLGMVTSITDPEGRHSSLFYNCNGHVATRTDAAGETMQLEYDGRNRLTRMIYPGGLGEPRFGHDQSGLLTNIAYLSQAAERYQYNALRQLTNATGVALERNVLGAITKSNGIEIEYDANGRITKMTFEPGKTVQYSYDRRDLVTLISDWTGATISFEYDAIGRMTHIRRPNGVVTSFSYSKADRVLRILETNQTTSLSSISLERDGLGQITNASRTTPLVPRLTPSTWSYAYQAGDRISGYEYDKLGRLANDGVRRYHWDEAHRLVRFETAGETVRSTFDALGSRLSRTSNAGVAEFTWNYALSLPSISVIKQAGRPTRYFVHTPAGKLLYSIGAEAGSHRFYHFDEMGNTIFLTDSSGQITDKYAYTPFGSLLDSQTTGENPFTFAGAYGVYHEPNTSLHLMRARCYDSHSARFLSTDPIWADISSIKTLNPYQYAAQNPLLYHDPRGTREYDLFFFESDAESADLQIAAFWNLYRDRNAHWASSAQEIKSFIDDYLKDSSCDCIRSITLVGHGVRGQAPFGLSLSTVEFQENSLKKRVFPRHVRDAWLSTTSPEATRGYMREVAEDFYREQTTDPTAQLMVVLMNVRWCPENKGVYFWSCNLLGSWGWGDDQEIARFQQLSNRLGIELNGSKSALKTTGRFGTFGFTHTVVPNPRAW